MTTKLFSALMRLLQSTAAVTAVLLGINCINASTVFASSAMTVVPAAANAPVSTTLSKNWAGYAATGSTYTSVSGTWIVPTVAASASVAADATWVGIGGVDSHDLIQAGTQTITENGQVGYQAWYELLPQSSTPVSLTVRPGDVITTTITETSPNVWEITIQNATTGTQYSTSVHYTSAKSSVEWIQEMPSDAVSFIPLDSFGSVPFTGASTIANGAYQTISQSGAQAITMVNGGNVLAAPSALGADGASFTVARSSAGSAIVPHTVQLYRRGFARGGDGDQQSSSSVPNTTILSTGPDGGQIVQIIRSLVTSSSQGSGPMVTESHTYTNGNYTVHVTYTHN